MSAASAAHRIEDASAPVLPLLQLHSGIAAGESTPAVEAVEAAPLSPAGQRGFDLLSRRIPESYLPSFRQLRGRLARRRELAESGGERFRTLLVTSPEPGDGKTFVASNLALMLAVPDGARVLLAEGNIDRPVFQSRFDLPPAPGLREIAAGMPWPAAVRQLPGMNLYVSGLSAADPSAMERIDFSRLGRWIGPAACEFDWIVLDGPALDSPEAEMLSYLSDGVLVVLRPGTTSLQAADAALSKVDPARLAGAVFNGRG